MSDYEVFDSTQVLSDVSELSEENKYKTQVRALTLQFMQKRLNNTSNLESVKSIALEKLVLRLASDDDIPISSLLKIVETLGNQNATDLNGILGKMSSGSGGKDTGNTYNIFNGADPTPAPAPQMSPEVFKLLDQLVQISETITANKD